MQLAGAQIEKSEDEFKIHQSTGISKLMKISDLSI